MQLDYLDADEDTLIGFLERHAGTLEDVTLTGVNLVEGNWISALPRVRDAVNLKNFCTSKALTSVNPRPGGQHWYIDCQLHLGSLETPEHMARNQRLGTAIKEYVLNGGDCPLLDHATYPQGSHHLQPNPT